MYAHTIAVLPFVNRSADANDEFFSDGITEEIINALSQIEHLKVTSRTSSFFFKNKNIPIASIAKQLGADIILEGSVRKAGETFRITAQLVEAEGDFHFWSATWDRQMHDLFAVQDEISLLIAEKIREHTGHFDIKDHLVAPNTHSLPAYEYALQARYYFNKWNPTDVQVAISLYEKVLHLEPNHVDAMVGLSDAYGFLATTEVLPRQETWEKAVAYTNQALALSPEHAGAHYQLANIAFFTHLDFYQAFVHAQKAIQLLPNHPEAQQFVAFLYLLRGDTSLAKRHIQLALAINPLSQETQFFKAYYDYRVGAYSSALSALEELLRLNPNNIPAYIVKCYCWLQLGMWDDVIHFIQSMPEEIMVSDEQLGILTLTYLLQGDVPNGTQYMAKLEIAKDNPAAFQAHSYWFMALVVAQRIDEAFQWMEKAMQMKSSVLLLSYSDPIVATIQNDPRYLTIHAQLYAIPEVKTKASNPLPISTEKVAKYKDQLLRHMVAEEPYLNPNLSLRSLADQVGLTSNQLSWLLNEQMDQNFNAFINHYRVESFKQLALDPANAHISLLGLAFQSGFNSKTVFNTYFKREVGLTPKAFLQASSK